VEAARIAWRPLGRLLVEQGLLTDDELERALVQQQVSGKRLGETIVALGFVSGPDLASALATQYGIELTVETGFGTGLRAQIQRRHENDRGLPGPPALSVVEALPAEPEDFSRAVDDNQPDVDGGAEALLLTQLEEQWARLAAAEDAIVESEREVGVLRRERDRRRKQAVRLIGRLRDRDRQLEQPHDELEQLGRVREEQHEEIERLTDEAKNRNAEIERLTRDVKEGNAEIDRLAGDGKNRDAEIGRLTQDLENRNGQIDRLTSEAKNRGAEVDRLVSKAKEHHAEIERLTGEAKNRNAEIERLTREAEDRAAGLDRITDEATGRKAEIERLTGDVAGCDAEIERLRLEGERLRAQATRFATRLRREPVSEQSDLLAPAPVPDSHLVFVQLGDGYELVESDGPPPSLHTLLELPQFSEDEFVVTRLGHSPLPADARSCVFVQRV
jgi:DNA repair exonuclease SbcCD ATPase subunit